MYLGLGTLTPNPNKSSGIHIQICTYTYNTQEHAHMIVNNLVLRPSFTVSYEMQQSDGLKRRNLIDTKHKKCHKQKRLRLFLRKFVFTKKISSEVSLSVDIGLNMYISLRTHECIPHFRIHQRTPHRYVHQCM